MLVPVNTSVGRPWMVVVLFVVVYLVVFFLLCSVLLLFIMSLCSDVDVYQVRRDGTYVYEEFLSTFGTDVKVYTVGQIFAHAEARKAPTLDGKVQRSPNGKVRRGTSQS